VSYPYSILIIYTWGLSDFSYYTPHLLKLYNSVWFSRKGVGSSKNKLLQRTRTTIQNRALYPKSFRRVSTFFEVMLNANCNCDSSGRGNWCVLLSYLTLALALSRWTLDLSVHICTLASFTAQKPASSSLSRPCVSLMTRTLQSLKTRRKQSKNFQLRNSKRLQTCYQLQFFEFCGTVSSCLIRSHVEQGLSNQL